MVMHTLPVVMVTVAVIHFRAGLEGLGDHAITLEQANTEQQR